MCLLLAEAKQLVQLVMAKAEQLGMGPLRLIVVSSFFARRVRFRSSVETNTDANIDNGKLFVSPRSSITTATENGAAVPRVAYLTAFSFGRVPTAAAISDPIP